MDEIFSLFGVRDRAPFKAKIKKDNTSFGICFRKDEDWHLEVDDPRYSIAEVLAGVALGVFELEEVIVG